MGLLEYLGLVGGPTKEEKRYRSAVGTSESAAKLPLGSAVSDKVAIENKYGPSAFGAVKTDDKIKASDYCKTLADMTQIRDPYSEIQARPGQDGEMQCVLQKII